MPSLRCVNPVVGLPPLHPPPPTLSFFRIRVKEAVRCSRTCDSLVKSPPSSFPCSLSSFHHLTKGRRCVSILLHSTGYRPVPPQCGSRGTAAQRSAPERSWRRAEERRKGRKDVLSPFRQAGLYSAASRHFNMPLGSKRLAGITALIGSLLLGCCGTGGEGERLRARPGKERRLFSVFY